MANDVVIHVKAKDDASKTMSSVGDKARKMGQLAATAGKVVGTALVAGAVLAVKAASDLNETVNKSSVIFGKNQKDIASWAQGAAKNLGLSTQQAMESAASFGDMFLQLGFARGSAVKMSKSVVQLAADLGSFNNLPTADVQERIAAAFRGEYDSLQALVPTINAAKVEQVALATTGKKSADALTQQEKAAAVLKIVMDSTKRAQGDFARTSDGLANSIKTVKAQLQDMAASVGQHLLPFVNGAMKSFSGFLDDLGKNKDLKRALNDLKGTFKSLGASNLDEFFANLNASLPETVDNINSVAKAFGKLHGGIKGTEDAMDKGLGLEKVLKFRATVIRMLANVAAAWAKSPLAPAGAKKAAAALDAMADAAEKDLSQVRQEFQKTANKVNRTKVESKVKADIHDLQAKIRTAQQRLRETHNKKTQAKIRAEIGQLQAQVASAKRYLASVHSRTVTLSIITRRQTRYSTVGQPSYGGHDPGYARGGNVGAADGGNRSGQIMVGERGPEMVQLPSGSHVFPNGNTASMMGRRGGSGINIYVNAPNYVGTPADLLRALVDAKRRGQLDVILR